MPTATPPSLLHTASPFHNSLQELRGLSSHFYHAAHYCETSFFSAQDKAAVMENTKQYISTAIVAVVARLGSISADLEACLTQTNSIPQTQERIDFLKMRIMGSQQRSQNCAISRFYLSPGFSRHHMRYILPHPATWNAASRDSNGGTEANSGRKEQFETEEPLFLHTYDCKQSLVENSLRNVDNSHGLSPPVVAVRGDGLSISPKSEQSIFQFQSEGGHKVKRSMINWKKMQNKEIASLIKRGKRILP